MDENCTQNVCVFVYTGGIECVDGGTKGWMDVWTDEWKEGREGRTMASI